MAYLTKYSGLILLLLIISLPGCFPDKHAALQKEIAVQTDTLSLDNTRDTLLIGARGTVLFFPKNVFVFPDGTQPKGKIAISLKECFSFSDMIREGLTTMSGNQLLETRGMVYIAAFADNKELQLKQGKSYIIHFPKDTAETHKIMSLYMGSIEKGNNINWNIDTQSLVKPTAAIREIGYTYSCIDSSTQEGYFAFRDNSKMNVHLFFSQYFDNKKLTLGDKLFKKYYLFSFTKTKTGDLINKKITEVTDRYFDREQAASQEVDPYVIQFFNSIPALSPDFCKEKEDSTHGDIIIGFGYFPDYRNKEEYNHQFTQKYSAFKNATIRTMNDAELNYYIFSSTKLGWINCDYFWETQDEKITYTVKIDPASKPDVKLIFENAKSIMSGTIEGDNYVFHNVPVNQDIKVVAIAFKGDKPLLGIAETKTSKTAFDKIQYKDFTLTELEKELNTP